jgi:methylated-DNA-protein-cysteine methyltransferase related protein
MKEKVSFNHIYEVVKLIPPGRATSYGAIAKYLGTGARMVGWAMNGCHANPEVPAHRVVNQKGLLTGKHFFGENRMQELLEAEGVEVKNDQIMSFDKIFWSPMDELL